MKTRIASSIALAAGIAFGATGCGLIAPQATTYSYAPSDGVEANVGDIAVRNLLLVASESGESFNVVFTAVNATSAPVQLRISFVGADEAAVEASADFPVDPGTVRFGDPEGDALLTSLVAIPGISAGDTVTAYLQIAGTPDVELQVPVLDGTLAEYQPYVLPDAPEEPEVVVDDADEEPAEETPAE
ncbi:DNA modification methylase [Leucobacter weissii]|uniref:DNA modification methylase n=1 Tax=Leucobacter weissii TaxID=1983706 RepID=A0A939SAT3_9MICO|nr:DNA modification methylase [Leucobacter weissii]MBO1902277.1 DNA modification methylase [Leucobacter weissii]